MSFSGDTKKELALIIPEKKCCMLAEIAGFMRMNGSIRLLGGGKFAVSASSENPAIARMLKKLIQSYFDAGTSIEIIQGNALRKGKKYRLSFDSAMTGEQMLRETGLLAVHEGSNVLTEGISQDVVKKKCCKRAYLRGLFLASGSVNHPERGYHLEIVCKNEYISNDIKKLMNTFSLNAKTTERRNQFIVYIKESEHIVDFMNIIGAYNQLLEYENIRIIKDMRNLTNRIVNCENANVDKAVNASSRQIESIKLIDSNVGISSLPEKLRIVADLRMQNPELPLKELAALIEPPLGKSGLNHRLARIEEIADKFRDGGKD